MKPVNPRKSEEVCEVGGSEYRFLLLMSSVLQSRSGERPARRVWIHPHLNLGLCQNTSTTVW